MLLFSSKTPHHTGLIRGVDIAMGLKDIAEDVPAGYVERLHHENTLLPYASFHRIMSTLGKTEHTRPQNLFLRTYIQPSAAPWWAHTTIRTILELHQDDEMISYECNPSAILESQARSTHCSRPESWTTRRPEGLPLYFVQS
jgi:hypothetical protein